jgi:hypothetical protein
MQKSYFAPKDLKILTAAYRQACEALKFAFFSKEKAATDKTRDDLAKVVLDVAKTSEQEPTIISTEALRRMPPMQADWRE